MCIREEFEASRICNNQLWPLSLSLANIPLSPETAQDQERRIRREIANSNERRRMQSINAGFQSLKTLLPHTDGEKLSKVQKTDTVEMIDLAVVAFMPSRYSSCFCERVNCFLEIIFLLFCVRSCQAAILQQTADYIFALEQEKTQLLAQNNQLKRFIQVTVYAVVFLHDLT